MFNFFTFLSAISNFGKFEKWDFWYFDVFFIEVSIVEAIVTLKDPPYKKIPENEPWHWLNIANRDRCWATSGYREFTKYNIYQF